MKTVGLVESNSNSSDTLQHFRPNENNAGHKLFLDATFTALLIRILLTSVITKKMEKFCVSASIVGGFLINQWFVTMFNRLSSHQFYNPQGRPNYRSSSIFLYVMRKKKPYAFIVILSL